MYTKISKWIFWLLALISVVIMVWGSAIGFQSHNAILVSAFLDWAYILFFASIALVIVLGIVLGAITDPKSLLKLGINILVLLVLVGISFLISTGDPLTRFIGTPPSSTVLKISDALLNLTYILSALAVLAIVVSEVISAIRNKR